MKKFFGTSNFDVSGIECLTSPQAGSWQFKVHGNHDGNPNTRLRDIAQDSHARRHLLG